MQVSYLYHSSTTITIAFSLIQGVGIWSLSWPCTHILNNDSLRRHLHLIQHNRHRQKISSIVINSIWQTRHNNMLCRHDILFCIVLTFTARKIFAIQTKMQWQMTTKMLGTWQIRGSDQSARQITRFADWLFVLTPTDLYLSYQVVSLYHKCFLMKRDCLAGVVINLENTLC